TLGLLQSQSILIDDQTILDLNTTDLRFVVDGPSGSEVVIDNVRFPGLGNGDFSVFDTGWFIQGDGSVVLAGMLDGQQYGALREILSESTGIPEPPAIPLLTLGLAGMAWVLRRCRARLAGAQPALPAAHRPTRARFTPLSANSLAITCRHEP